jgi:iron complex outermembrane receptor protein
MQKIITIFSLVLVSAAAHAQTFNIAGKLKDAAGQPIGTATVSLLKADSTFIRSELTDGKGGFQFEKLAAGNYILAALATGYKKQVTPVALTKDTELPAIMLQPVSKELKEVTVSGKRPYIEQALGKTIVNVDQSATGAGTNVLELLRKTPGLVVTGNGNIQMNGTGVNVMIDDKPTYLTGDQLADYLKSLPAEQVAQLELIAQPSAKYDAEGEGILNIKTKKNRKAGVNANIMASYSQGVYPGTENTANVNYRKDKLNLYANGAYLNKTGFLNQHTIRKVTDLQAGTALLDEDQNSFLKENFVDYNLKTGVDYDINEKTTVGGSVNGIYHPNHEQDVTNSRIMDLPANNYTINNTTSNQKFHRDYLTTNAYLKWQPAKEQELSVDADYRIRNYTEHRDIVGINYDSMMNVLPNEGLNLQDDRNSAIRLFVLKADYSTALKNNVKLEAGVKTNYSTTGNATEFHTLQNGTWQYDSTRSNEFIYTENINAAYVNLNKGFGKKWQVQAGLRMENMNAEGRQSAGDKEFTITNTKVFPTAFVGYKANEKNSFELNYGIRLNRPGYIELNPFINYLSQYSYSVGNPGLVPEMRQYVEFNHNCGGTFISSVGYRKVTKDINPVLIYDAATKATYSTEKNNATKQVLFLSETMNKQLFDWWMLASSADLYYNQYLLEDSHDIRNTVGYDISVNNQFSFKHGWSVDTSFTYSSGMYQSPIEHNLQSYWLGFNVSKKIWKDTATIKFSAEDPFNDYSYRPEKEWAGVSSKSDLRYATRQFSLGFSYNFGKKLEDRSHSNNIEEAKRM